MRPHVLTLFGVLLLVALVSATRTPADTMASAQTAAAPQVAAQDGGSAVRPTRADLHDPTSAAWRRYLVHDERYFATVDPTRIYVDRPLRPGEVRPPLAPVSARFGFGRPQEAHATPLQVRTRPEAPVTFYAPDFGTFANGERCITVRADVDGLASAEFTYGATATAYRVVAHSPDAIGWVVFQLEARDGDLPTAVTQKGGQS